MKEHMTRRKITRGTKETKMKNMDFEERVFGREKGKRGKSL